MRAPKGKFRWEFLIFALLLGIDVLVGLRAVQRILLKQGEISPDAPFFLLFLLLLQVALLIVFDQWKRTLQDHHKLKETYEHELELSHQIMENIESAIIVVDSEGRYVYANRACSELLGLPAQGIVGQTAEALMVFPPGVNQATLWTTPLTEAMLVPVTLKTASGKTIDVTVKVSPRWYGGRVVGAIASVVPAEQVNRLRTSRTENPVTGNPV